MSGKYHHYYNKMSGKRCAELQEFLSSYCCGETVPCSPNPNPHVQSDSDSDGDSNGEIHRVDSELHEEITRARAACPHCSDLLSKFQTRIQTVSLLIINFTKINVAQKL